MGFCAAYFNVKLHSRFFTLLPLLIVVETILASIFAPPVRPPLCMELLLKLAKSSLDLQSLETLLKIKPPYYKNVQVRPDQTVERILRDYSQP